MNISWTSHVSSRHNYQSTILQHTHTYWESSNNLKYFSAVRLQDVFPASLFPTCKLFWVSRCFVWCLKVIEGILVGWVKSRKNSKDTIVGPPFPCYSHTTQILWRMGMVWEAYGKSVMIWSKPWGYIVLTSQIALCQRKQVFQCFWKRVIFNEPGKCTLESSHFPDFFP